MDEDLGFTVVLEGLDLMQTKTKAVYTTDDASLQSFGAAWGRPAPPPPTQPDNSDSGNNRQCEGSATPPTDEDAAAPDVSGGSVV